MFKQATLMNSDLSAWDMGHVVNMSGMFTEAANFNGNISTWNTSSLENASRMFAGATISIVIFLIGMLLISKMH